MDTAHSARLKLERAKSLVDDLLAISRQYVDGDPIRVEISDNVTARRREWRATLVTPLPPTIALVTGDVIHNLRASLDHLAGELVRAAGGTPTRRTEFPISLRDEQHFRSILGTKLPHLTTEAESILNSLQPWEGGNSALVQLHKLDVIDKHRLVLAAAVANTSLALDTLGLMAAAGVDVAKWQEQADDLRVYYNVAEPDVIGANTLIYSTALGEPGHEDTSFRFAIGLNEPDVGAHSDLDAALQRFVVEVERVITAFEPVL